MVLWYPKTRHLTRTNGKNFWKVQDLGDLPLTRRGSMRTSTPTGCSRNFERLQSALHQGLPLRGAVSRRLTERCCRSGVLRKTYGNRSCPNTSPSRCARHLPSRGGLVTRSRRGRGRRLRRSGWSHGFRRGGAPPGRPRRRCPRRRPGARCRPGGFSRRYPG